jgi:hypothetical protein
MAVVESTRSSNTTHKPESHGGEPAEIAGLAPCGNDKLQIGLD